MNQNSNTRYQSLVRISKEWNKSLENEWQLVRKLPTKEFVIKRKTDNSQGLTASEFWY